MSMKSIYGFCFLCLFHSIVSVAEEQHAFQFDTSFLQGTNRNPKALRSSSGIIAGRYLATVLVNGQHIGRRELVITSEEEQADKLCLTTEFFNSLSTTLTQEAYNLALIERQCIDLSRIDFTSIDFDITSPLLTLTIPQRYLDKTKTRAEALQGINGVKLGYNLNANLDSRGNEAGFGSFDMQTNVLDWVTHADFASSWSSGGETENNLSNLYATRPLTSLGADVVIGKGYTSANFVDGFSFGGIGLTSNRLISDSTSSYLPDISGIANLTSRITVRQHGRILYSEVIAPGPYKIDTFSVFGSGDLNVEIKDTNGHIEEKTYPLVAMPSLLREDYSDFNIAIGKRHQGAGIDKLFDSDRDFLFAEGRYGFNSFTAGTGLILDEKYQSIGVGSTLYLGMLGSLSINGAISFADYDNGERLSGITLGTEYAYQLSTNTHLQLAAYRYRDEDYVTYSSFYPEQANDERQYQKHRFQAVVSSKFNDVNVNLMGWQQSYWKENESDIGASLSMNTTWWETIGTNLSVGYSVNGGRNDVTSSLMFSLPLQFADNYHHVSTTASVGTNSDFSMTANAGGNLNDRVSYSTSVGDFGISTGLSYQHDKTQLNAGVNYADGYSSLSLGASGSALWTQPSGLMLARNNFETLAVVDVNGINDVDVNGARTNSNGFALINLQPYQVNTIDADVGTIPVWAEIDTGSQQIIPLEGAIIHHVIDSRRVYRYTLEVKNRHGEKLDSGDINYQGYYLGSIAPNGIVTIAMQQQFDVVSVNQGVSACDIDLTSIKPNLTKLFEVTCE